MFGAGDDAGGRLDAWVAEAKAKAQRYQAMREQAQQVSVTESSKDGLVTVTVDSGGNVTDLRITDRVRELSGAQVAASVLAAMRKAQSRLPERLGDVMATTIGDDQATVQTIVGNYRSRFPEPEPEDQAPASNSTELRIGAVDEDEDSGVSPPPAPPPRRPAPRRPVDGDDDEGWGDQSILQRG
jgi:DNA-binding protein YbaB